MDNYLLEIIACPICHSRLAYNKEHQKLICTFDALAYPIREGIPILLRSEASNINLDESNNA